MARILDSLHPPESRRHREADVKAALSTMPAPIPDDDETDVPFIEVGAPTMKQGNLKPTRHPAPVATILPLTRPSVERMPDPPRVVETEAFPIFPISFQPLPLNRELNGPAGQRFVRELIAFHQPNHPISEQYRGLMLKLEEQLGTEPGKSLLFTASHPAAGVTTVLLNLAISYARRDGARVAVVDANFARPALAERLGIPPTPGLREVLARTVPLIWGLQETGQPNLNALTGGQMVNEPNMDIWPLVLDQLKQRFDWVLVDAAEWGRGELPALAGTCAATYLVLGQGDLAAPELNDLLGEIPRHGGHLRGYVLRSP